MIREQGLNHWISHIASILNTMADDASHLQHLSDQELIDYFNSHYPQKVSWVLYPPPSKLLSTVISILLSNKLQEVSQQNTRSLLTRTLGAYGVTSVQAWVSTLSEVKDPVPYLLLFGLCY